MTDSRKGIADQWSDSGDEVLPEESRPPTVRERREVERLNRGSADKAQMAANLKIAGFEDFDIAKKCGYTTPGAARAAYEHVFAQAHGSEDRVAMRAVMSSQLDALLRSLAPKALHSKMAGVGKDGAKTIVDNPEHLPHAAAFARILEQKARLHGLNAPQVVAMIDPSAEEFQETLRMIAQDQGFEQPNDVDIFELEEGEDGVFSEAAPDE